MDGHQREEGRENLTGIMRRVVAALTGQEDCTLCNDEQWWIDNGFTEAERRHFCASIGCPIPPAA